VLLLGAGTNASIEAAVKATGDGRVSSLASGEAKRVVACAKAVAILRSLQAAAAKVETDLLSTGKILKKGVVTRTDTDDVKGSIGDLLTSGKLPLMGGASGTKAPSVTAAVGKKGRGRK